MLGKLQAVGKRSQTGDQLQSDQARQQDSHQRNDCQIQQYRPRTPFIKMNQQKRQHRHGKCPDRQGYFCGGRRQTRATAARANIPAGNSIGDSIADSPRACCVLPTILQNRNHHRNPEHCRKRKLEACTPESAAAWAQAEATPPPQGRFGRSGVRLSSPAAKNSKNMTRGAPGRNAHSGQLRVCNQNPCGNSGAQSNRKPYFFQKSEQSCADQGQVQSGNCQQMADSCALV